MKKLACVLMMVCITLLLASCSNKKNAGNDINTYFYIGQSDSWLATYTITKVESYYYDLLTIQYIFHDKNENSTEKIGPIEYQLVGKSKKSESSFPQELQGVGNFHTGSIINADAFKITFDDEMDLSIQWKDKNESIQLKRQN